MSIHPFISKQNYFQRNPKAMHVLLETMYILLSGICYWHENEKICMKIDQAVRPRFGNKEKSIPSFLKSVKFFPETVLKNLLK